MKKSLLFLLTAFSLSVSAQETVQWATEVMYVTSEYGPLQYSAAQTLSRPNVYPNSGPSPNTWRAKKPNGEDFIVVQFEKFISAQQIAIAETENPGAITKVYAYDKYDNEYLLFELTPRKIPVANRLLNLFFEKTHYNIAYIRVDIDGSAVDGYNAIDAIGISESNVPIKVLMKLTDYVNEDLYVDKMSKNVNSSYVEHNPILSPDGQTLFFSRRNHPDNVGGVADGEDIWFCTLNETTGEWGPARNIGPPLNNAGPNFITSVTQQGDELVVLLGNQYTKRGKMLQGVSRSKYLGGHLWDTPENIEIENDYNYSNNADYFANEKHNVIIMSVERDDTYGDRDLYATFNIAGRGWSEPMNLGPDVNSADTESAPFLVNDNRTLYFSSKGFPGFGGADIFVTRRLGNGWSNWSTPENLGPAVNSPTDDLYFNIPSSGNMAYLSKGDPTKDTDIYQFKVDEFFIKEEIIEDTPKEEKAVEEILVAVKGKVLNSKTNEPIGTKIFIERLPDGASVGITSSNKNGDYEFRVRPGALYGFFAEAEGYLSVSSNIEVGTDEKAGQIERDLFLTPIEKGVNIIINNIFFDVNEADLHTASFPELDRILNLLDGNKIDKIEISGHTDSSGNDNYNLDLSQRRADAVYNYFVSNGISRSRVVSKGYGESKPIASNDTEENRSKNRRVEFKVL
ncbi:MAG: OmpA family protein [Cyclobacteriaceae bacterium]